MEQGGDVLGRSGEDSGSQAERDAIALPLLALVRAAPRAAASKGVPWTTCVVCWRATGETFGVKRVQCAGQGHAASGEVQRLRAGDSTAVFSHHVIVPLCSKDACGDALGIPLS